MEHHLPSTNMPKPDLNVVTKPTGNCLGTANLFKTCAGNVVMHERFVAKF
jgi:hypothetical protein